MSDVITALIGFFGVLVGAAVGFFGLRWQHRAELMQQIRAKGADLIFLGDQYREECAIPQLHVSLRSPSAPPLPPGPQQLRLDQMLANVRYLELVADDRTFALALAYKTATENLDGIGFAMVGEQKIQERYEMARHELKSALRTRAKK